MTFGEIYHNWKDYAMGIRKETGEERQFDTGAKKQHATGKGTPVLVPGDAILDVAKHFEEGAAVHGDRNWEKGIPLSELLNSAERHLQQIKMGLTDESHERAFAWNAIVYLATKLRIEAGILPAELDDMPRYHIQKRYFTEIEISKIGFWYYICSRGEYLWRDLLFHRVCCSNGCKNAEGYYETEELAEETLQTYLDKNKQLDVDIRDIHYKYKYICDECEYKFNTPIVGEFKQGTDLLLNGCPVCGCSSYRKIGDFQYPDLCEHCAEKCRKASLGEAVGLCRECSERKV